LKGCSSRNLRSSCSETTDHTCAYARARKNVHTRS
jgi:hypothetical protein